MVVAQNRSTMETRALTNQYRQSKSIDKMSKTLLDRYPLRYDGKEVSIGVLAQVTEAFDQKALEQEGIKVTSRVADIVSMRVPLNRLEVLEHFSGIEVYSVAHKVAPMMDNTRYDTRTDSVQAGLGVPMPFNGEGVLIGITDWGFDYTHPNLNKKSNQRILRAWDHFKLSGPHPDGFDYGTEYIGYDQLKAAGGDTSGLYGYGTHGTHVAGICGGNGTQGHCIGQAPGAEFLLGSWYLDEASWLDQVAWMKGVAQNEGKRLVINSSWGMYTFSTLDGTSLLSRSVDAYADSGIVFVTSGGNNGDTKFHLQHQFSNNDTMTSIATYYGDGIGQALIYWGEPAGQFQVGFAMINNSNIEEVYYSPLFSTADDIAYQEGYILVGADTVRYDIMTESSNPFDQRPHALLNVAKKYGYKLMMVCTAQAGVNVHVWNVCNLENHAGNIGCDFENGGIFGCQNGDKMYGIGEPACSEKTLTVAAHAADHFVHDTVLVLGDLTTFSSYGPTIDNRNKPEISAPGQSVISSLSSWADVSNYQAVYNVMSGGRHYIWAAMSGTSMSSPAVTGVVALMLQANPNLSVDQVREIIFTTARNDERTGALHANDSVSYRWGYGKIDALKAVNAAYDKLSIEEAIANPATLVVYPNPAQQQVVVRTGSNMPASMELFAIDGRRVMQCTVSDEATLDISALNDGVYIIRVQDRTGVRTAKVVKR